MNVVQLELLSGRVHRLRALCKSRRVDMSDMHHNDLVEEAFDLASRLGSPWPFFATIAEFPDSLLGVDGETIEELRPKLAEYLAG